LTHSAARARSVARNGFGVTSLEGLDPRGKLGPLGRSGPTATQALQKRKTAHPAAKYVGSCDFAFLEPAHDVFVDLWRELLEVEQHEHGCAYASNLVDQRALDVPEHDHRFRLRQFIVRLAIDG
jgi:hypothetical protein